MGAFIKNTIIILLTTWLLAKILVHFGMPMNTAMITAAFICLGAILLYLFTPASALLLEGKTKYLEKQLKNAQKDTKSISGLYQNATTVGELLERTQNELAQMRLDYESLENDLSFQVSETQRLEKLVLDERKELERLKNEKHDAEKRLEREIGTASEFSENAKKMQTRLAELVEGNKKETMRHIQEVNELKSEILTWKTLVKEIGDKFNKLITSDLDQYDAGLLSIRNSLNKSNKNPDNFKRMYLLSEKEVEQIRSLIDAEVVA